MGKRVVRKKSKRKTISKNKKTELTMSHSGFSRRTGIYVFILLFTIPYATKKSKILYSKSMRTISAIHAATWKDKIIGLIGKKEIKPLYFETRWGIHTFGVKKPIDVLILDSNGFVQAYKEHLLPNRFFLWSPKYKRVIELPEGTIKKDDLKLGTKIIVQT